MHHLIILSVSDEMLHAEGTPSSSQSHQHLERQSIAKPWNAGELASDNESMSMNNSCSADSALFL